MFVSLKSTTILALVVPAMLLAACSANSDEGPAPASATTIAVTATDTECSLDQATVASGPIDFTVTNSGNEVTEVYVYGQNGDAFTTVVSEVENIGPGVARDMSANLAPGAYEIACKPGQTGDGIRTVLTVTGDQTAAPIATASPVRAIDLGIDSSDTLTGLAGQSALVEERIEFEVTNSAGAKRNFEVKRPDGSVAGEVEIAAGKKGDLTLDMNFDGTWSLIVEGGATETEADFVVS
ncbi:MAG: cupredoxin domain-containing protein [Actinomycetota bacterium]|nr:cupredoxin domain-containing protein [Actinomycetota bacterium]